MTVGRMNRMNRSGVGLVLLACCVAVNARAADWPAWRGPHGTGVYDEVDLPTTWSATENVAWKAPLPGPGNSTPVVAAGRVFVTCASDKGATRSVLCFDRASGKLLWRQDTKFTGEETTHETNPYCAASPATDGRRVFAWHGSAGVVAYDAQGGKPLWQRDLGPFRHIWGNASSPVLYGEKLILQLGPGPETRLVALDARSGQTVWENDLPEAKGKAPDHWKGSWGTPVLYKADDGRTTLVAGLPQYVAGFDPESGKELWRCRGLGDLVYTNPLIGNGVIVQMSGYQGPALALRVPKPGETGDLTASHRLWLVEKGNPQRVGSGVIADEHVYILNDPGVAECIELRTGKQVWKQRAAHSSWGSMVLSGDRLYVTDMSGQTVVLRAGPKFELLHENALADGDLTRASVAVSDGQIFIRTYKQLYCIGAPRKS
jgi:outer membrane protein assembly factor BamB